MGRLSLRRLAGPRPAGRSTQATHVAVEAIEDGAVRLAGYPGPEHRAVLEVDGTAALPEIPREQEAVLAAYAAFLNGLAFPVQLLVRVLPYDFDAYVSRLARRTTAVCGADEGLASLAADHVAFLRRLARSQTLLEQRCYVVVPADSSGKTAAPASDAGSAARVADGRGQGPQPDLPESGRGWPWIRALRPRFGAPRTVRGATGANDEAAVHRSLAARCEEVSRLLARCGLGARRLDDLALAELFYACWCPDRSRVQRLRLHLEAYTAPVVRGAGRRGDRSDGPPALTRRPPPAARELAALEPDQAETHQTQGARPCD